MIPELPGEIVPRNSEYELWLKAHVAGLCRLDRDGFPGSQPVSFSGKDLESLEQRDYWVCEKSDGIRILFLIQADSQGQSMFIIDRHNTYRQVNGFFFPHHEDPRKPLGDTIIDGELVVDVDPRTRQTKLRLLAFDCLVVDNQNVMPKTLDKRYGRLTDWVYKPYLRMMRDHPHMAGTQPFEIELKEINFSYHVEKVFAVDIPSLRHGNDGLIYTCVGTPYSPGTDPNILKWKPPSENSIDFKLVLRFPPLPSDPSQPNFHAKPIFMLHVWLGDNRGEPMYEQYDIMYVDDAEWERMKVSGEQVDDRIVEVHWDPEVSHWRMMRFRDDKPNGNHKNVVEKIVQSIADGVEKDTLLARSSAIRNAWKARQSQPQQPQAHPQPPAQFQPPPPFPLARVGRPPPAGMTPAGQAQVPQIELRYGPLAPSRWSKVAGPAIVAGMKR